MSAIKERPILYSGPMVKAVIDDLKKQTRRVIKRDPWQADEYIFHPSGVSQLGNDWRFKRKMLNGNSINVSAWFKCPYGRRGDKLWVKETHYMYGKWVKNGKTKTGRQRWKFKRLQKEVRYYDNVPNTVRKNSYRYTGWYKRPSIFMPRWASRIDLEITDIRIERVKGISESDAKAEGCLPCIGKSVCGNASCYGCPSDNAKAWFAQLWDSINDDRGYGWAVNPWVWVIEFKNITEKKGG